MQGHANSHAATWLDDCPRSAHLKVGHCKVGASVGGSDGNWGAGCALQGKLGRMGTARAGRAGVLGAVGAAPCIHLMTGSCAHLRTKELNFTRLSAQGPADHLGRVSALQQVRSSPAACNGQGCWTQRGRD